jgi:hypothetical protein
MPRNWVPCALAAATFALLAAVPNPASAEFFGCNQQHAVRKVAFNSDNQEPAYARHYAQARPRVTIYPRHSARRYCRSWLAKEYRVSGPVVVPRMRCWWR